MKISLTLKLAIAFLLTTFLTIVIAGVISNYMIYSKFDKYLIDQHKAEENKVIDTISNLFDETNGFSKDSVAEIKRYSDSLNLFIEVKDLDGNVLLNVNNLQSDSNMMTSNMHSMMNNFSSINPSQYSEDNYNLTKNNKKLGTIIIGYYDSSYFNNAALNFKMTLNKSLLLSILIALLLGLIISIFLSKQISKPLKKITITANSIRNGDLNARSTVYSKTKEIDDLIQSINYLGETLEKQEHLRKRLTSDMSHELRTPLTNLKSQIEAILDKVWEPTEEIMNSFYEEVQRLIKLVEQLNNLARLEETNLNLSKCNFDLSYELEKIVLSFKPLYKNNSLDIVSEIAPNIIVFMDKDKIRQVVFNLLSNSLKYSKAGGITKLSLKIEKGNTLVEVKDNGIGISEKDLPYIFERFYRSDISRDKNTGGAGIGLTIAKTIVEAHKGTIKVNSKLNFGTTFVICFSKENSVIKKAEI